MKIGILGCDDHILAVAVAAVEGGHSLSPAYDVPDDLPAILSGIDRQPREQWQGLLEDELCDAVLVGIWTCMTYVPRAPVQLIVCHGTTDLAICGLPHGWQYMLIEVTRTHQLTARQRLACEAGTPAFPVSYTHLTLPTILLV